jgi:HPt (histidine-containing phosphotransfer) domain-containing protein
MQDKLNAIVEKHCETIKGNVGMLGRLLLELSAGCDDPRGTAARAESLTHQLKGSGGTAGFKDISAAAAALDEHLKMLCRERPELIRFGVGEAMRLFAALEGTARDVTPASSTLYKAL